MMDRNACPVMNESIFSLGSLSNPDKVKKKKRSSSPETPFLLSSLLHSKLFASDTFEFILVGVETFVVAAAGDFYGLGLGGEGVFVVALFV